jgi:hypothetical protein
VTLGVGKLFVLSDKVIWNGKLLNPNEGHEEKRFKFMTEGEDTFEFSIDTMSDIRAKCLVDEPALTLFTAHSVYHFQLMFGKRTFYCDDTRAFQDGLLRR